MECPVPNLYAKTLSVTKFIRFRWGKGGVEGGPRETVQLVRKEPRLSLPVSHREGHVVA